jgi:methylmalonyl-CoA mutase
VIDPSGGCYYIESLTSELATMAWSLMQDLESEGGMVRCLRAGKIHELIEPVAKARIEAVNKRKDVFVGINMYANPLEKEPVSGSESDVPESSKAVELDKGALPRHRAMENLENLRLSLAKSQANKQVFLLNMGSIAEFKARADFASEAVQAAKASGARAFCLCSTDENYINLVPELCKELKGQVLILAGYPTDLVESYKQQGINLFIHIRADVFNTLSQLATQMGVRS